MILHIERKDGEDDDNVDDEDWEDMEIEDDMWGIIYSLLALNKQQNSCYFTGRVY